MKVLLFISIFCLGCSSTEPSQDLSNQTKKVEPQLITKYLSKDVIKKTPQDLATYNRGLSCLI